MDAINKKIILTVTNDLTYDQRMQRICRSLYSGGYSVELVGREKPNSVALKTESFKQTRLHCWFHKGKLFYLEYNLRLFFYLLFTRFDAVCAIDLDTIAAAFCVGRIKRAKLVYDAHEYFTEVPEVVRRRRIQKVWQWVERAFVPLSDLSYTVSQGLAALFEAQYHQKFEVIRNVPYLKVPVQNEKVDIPPRFILYQGSLNEGRGLEQLIAAMASINCTLKLAGEGDLSEELRRLTVKLHLQHKVEFLGYVNPEQLKQLTSSAYIGINILENKGLNYYHSLANKFFDYLQAGVPQVCIDFPEYKKINGENQVALLIKNTSIHEIIPAVQRLLGDNSFYSQLQSNCIRGALKLNWQEEEKKLLSLYNELLR